MGQSAGQSSAGKSAGLDLDNHKPRPMESAPQRLVADPAGTTRMGGFAKSLFQRKPQGFGTIGQCNWSKRNLKRSRSQQVFPPHRPKSAYSDPESLQDPCAQGLQSAISHDPRRMRREHGRYNPAQHPLFEISKRLPMNGVREGRSVGGGRQARSWDRARKVKRRLGAMPSQKPVLSVRNVSKDRGPRFCAD